MLTDYSNIAHGDKVIDIDLTRNVLKLVRLLKYTLIREIIKTWDLNNETQWLHYEEIWCFRNLM